MKKYRFRKHNREYFKIFRKEEERLNELIPWNDGIIHIGSTSIKGLGGKGIVDILVILKKSDIEKSKRILVEMEYILMPNSSAKDRIGLKKYLEIFFKKRVHVHLTYKNSQTYKETLKFIKNLRDNPILIKKYEKLKKNAVQVANGDGKVYRKLKEDFIKKNSK